MNVLKNTLGVTSQPMIYITYIILLYIGHTELIVLYNINMLTNTESVHTCI